MKNLFIVLLFAIALPYSGKAQGVFVNYDVDSTIFDIGAPLKLWLDFLGTKDDSTGAQYWNQAEVEKYGEDSYFLLEKQLNFGTDNYLYLFSYATINVVRIVEVGDYFKITSMLDFSTDERPGNIQCLFNVFAGMDQGKLKLFNALAINTQHYLSNTTVGFIRFHYPKYHKFDYELAQKQTDFLVAFSREFGVEPDTVDYYFADTKEEVERMKGFDFVAGGSGQEIPTGIADAINRIVYCSGAAEYYPHEIIHVLLYGKYNNCHGWINEGMATYFGMSRGKPLDWHLEKTAKYLSEHQEIDLTNMLELITLDEYTGYRYALGGLVVQQAFEKGGYDLVKTLLNAGKTSAEFYEALEKHLGWKKDQLNTVIRDLLQKRYGEK